MSSPSSSRSPSPPSPSVESFVRAYARERLAGIVNGPGVCWIVSRYRSYVGFNSRLSTAARSILGGSIEIGHGRGWHIVRCEYIRDPVSAVHVPENCVSGVKRVRATSVNPVDKATCDMEVVINFVRSLAYIHSYPSVGGGGDTRSKQHLELCIDLLSSSIVVLDMIQNAGAEESSRDRNALE